MEQPHTAETVAARSTQSSGKTAQERITPKTIAFRDDLSMLTAYAGSRISSTLCRRSFAIVVGRRGASPPPSELRSIEATLTTHARPSI